MSPATKADNTTKLPDRIRAIAVRQFEQRGYEAVTIDDIVSEAGGTKGGFYYYFKSKADLLLALHQEYVEFSINCFREAFEAAGPDPKAQIEAFVYESFRQIHERREYVSLLFDERRALPKRKMKKVVAAKAALRDMLSEIIERGGREGVFRQVDSRAAGLAVFGMCTWGYLWYEPGGRMGWEDLAAEFAEIATRGLAAD